MPTFTAFVLAAFIGYGATWFFGMHEGNFSLLMLMACVVTGFYWLAEKFYFLPQRQRTFDELIASSEKRNQELAKQGISAPPEDLSKAQQAIIMQPWWLDWTAGLFPVIATVFLLRSFFFEPFKIPSGSMIPTLHIGDLILVNKYHYGFRLPVINYKVTQGNAVQRGDVMVFRYPPKPSMDYIKRVVGVPGDEIAFLNKQLTVNGQVVVQQSIPDFFDADQLRYSKQFEESMPTGSDSTIMTPIKKHKLLIDPVVPSFVTGIENFPYKDQCRYSVEGVICKVPQGHYFMMGDNRDNSLDSRYWGFVPDANIVGKAFYVWMNFGNLGRIGAFD